MPTSSITKEIIIKDEEALKRFIDIQKNATPLKLDDAETDSYEKGKELLKRISFR